MEPTSKRIKIVGKGHASCVEKLLSEWYRKESFVDVIFTCYESTEDGQRISRDPKQIPANRSVLAAASPVFSIFFRESPIVEENIQIILVGYSYDCVSSVVKYIYTGFLECANQGEEQVVAFLNEFSIPSPEKVSRKQLEPPVLPLLHMNAIPADQLRCQVDHGSIPQLLPTLPTSAVNPICVEIPVVIQPTTDNKYPHILRLRASAQSQPSPRIFNQKKVMATGSKVGVEKQIPVFKRNVKDTLSNDHSYVHVSMPLLQPRSKPKTYSGIQILNRNIDASPNQGGDRSCIDPPAMLSTEPLLANNWIEKSLVHPELLYPIPRAMPTTNSSLLTSSSHTDPSNLFYYRKTVSALNDVPGVFSFYKERYFIAAEHARVPLDRGPYFNRTRVQSYFVKTPVRNYQSTKPTDPKPNRPQLMDSTRSFLAKVGIESVHELNGKVHIRTKGEPLVNRESESLFEDDPDFLSRYATRLSVEHNYSFGESMEGVENEGPDQGDTEIELDDYRRAMQLTINSQRRRNRLMNRIQSYSKELTVLRRRARKLIDICSFMGDEAHEIDLSDQSTSRPIKKRRLEKPVSAESNQPEDPKVPCPICDKLLKKSWLKQHTLTVHAEERNHLCDECGRTFVLKSQLRNHQKRQHMTVPGNHMCDQCGRVFRFARYLNRHMSFHSSVKPHVCKYCNKAFRLKPVLIKHIRTHTGEKPYQCSTCGKCFRQRTTFANHLKTHEKKSASDGTTEADGSTSKELRRLKCEFCSMTFKLDLFLMLHRSKHTGETPVLPCPTCAETFPSIKELAQHRKTQHVESVFPCPLCPKLFLNKNNLDYHVEKHSNPDAVKKKYPMNPMPDTGPCTCDFCDKIFKSRTALDYHIKGIHLGNRGLKCQYCDKSFSHKPSLEQHVRTHTGERPYQCDQCPSAFKLQQHLAAHMVVHTGERPFSCEFCDKTFAHKTTLYAHLRIHTGKQLVCSHCKKVLPSVAQLVRHENVCLLNESAAAEVVDDQ